jgi:hypothetical protein
VIPSSGSNEPEIISSNSYGNGRPIIFVCGNGPLGLFLGTCTSYLNGQNDGLGTFTNGPVENVLGRSNSIRSEKLVAANTGAYALIYGDAQCGNQEKYIHYSKRVDGISNTETRDILPCPQGGNSPRYTEATFVVNPIDNTPLAAYVDINGFDDTIYIYPSANTLGTIPFTATPLFTPSSSIFSGSITFAKLPGGGFGIYYFYGKDDGSIRSYRYSYTTNTAGTSGYIHQTLFSFGTITDRHGVLGVDGIGRVFIANAFFNSAPAGTVTTSNRVQIIQAPDGLGTSFTQVAMIAIGGTTCTRPYVKRTRTVLLADNTPAFVAQCQDGRIVFVKSTTPSAAGPWTVQTVVTGNSRIFAVSLHITEGSNMPHIAYIRDTPREVVFIQARSQTNF